MEFTELLKRWVNPLRVKISNIAGRGIITKSQDPAGLQTLQVQLSKDEIKDDVQRLQNYGFTSYPMEGAQALGIFQDGSREGGIIVALDDARYRIQVSEGEVAMYSKFGNKIVMKDDGSIEATPAPGMPFKINGDVTATGTIHGEIDVIAGIAISLKTHVHSGGTISGSTGAPVGA